MIYSPVNKVDSYNCKLEAYSKGTNNELFLYSLLHFESNDQSNFPIHANVKFTILNQRDSRKDFSASKRNLKVP